MRSLFVVRAITAAWTMLKIIMPAPPRDGTAGGGSYLLRRRVGDDAPVAQLTTRCV